MSSSGPNYPTSAVDQNDNATPWSSVTNVEADDGNLATVTIAANGSSNTIFATGFGFNVPSTATINGILVEAKYKDAGGGGGNPTDGVVELLKAGAVAGGQNKGGTSAWPSTLTYFSYGGSTDLWQIAGSPTWSPSDINNSGFGVGFSANEGSGLGSCHAAVDDLRITVYYTTPAPSVSSVSANNGTAQGGNSVTITGTGFYGTPTVTFGGVNATGVSVTNSTTLTCTTPAHAAGSVTVVVQNQDGQSGTLNNGFTYNAAPTISSITPNAGPGGTSITNLAGTNFVSGATVKFGSNAATSVVVVSSTKITCTVPSGSGTVNVVVTLADGGTATLTNGYSYSISANFNASGQSITSSVHTPGVSIANNVTGVSSTTSVGAVTAPLLLIGVSSTTSVGQVGGSVSDNVTGVSSTTSVHGVTVAVGPNIVGVSSTTSIGSPTYTGTATIAVTGVRTTSSVGVAAATGISQAILGYFQAG